MGEMIVVAASAEEDGNLNKQCNCVHVLHHTVCMQANTQAQTMGADRLWLVPLQ